jgi:hypothetical protein
MPREYQQLLLEKLDPRMKRERRMKVVVMEAEEKCAVESESCVVTYYRWAEARQSETSVIVSKSRSAHQSLHFAVFRARIVESFRHMVPLK